MTIDVFAPAKINLSLRVGPPGLDGRHPLDSLVCFTATCGDALLFEHGDALSLNIVGPFADGLPSDCNNLVMRAAQLLADYGGSNGGTTITLTKRLPVASGIGGGSADAAAALVGLNQLWKLGATRDQLQVLGAALGADVPACVMGASLRMTGTGETIASVPPLPRFAIVLVNPLIPCPTGPVYRKYDQIGVFGNPDSAPLPDLTTFPKLLEFLRTTPNDLEPAAIVLAPQIGDILRAIETTEANFLARMSGSGATCFGLYPTLADAQNAAVAIKNTLASFPIWVEADQVN